MLSCFPLSELSLSSHLHLCFSSLSDVARGELVLRLEDSGLTPQAAAERVGLSPRRTQSLKALARLDAEMRSLLAEFRVAEGRVRPLIGFLKCHPRLSGVRLLRLVLAYQATGPEVARWVGLLEERGAREAEMLLVRVVRRKPVGLKRAAEPTSGLLCQASKPTKKVPVGHASRDTNPPKLRVRKQADEVV